MSLPPVFVASDSRLFVQEGGCGTEYKLIPCHASETAEITRADANRIYCKSAAQRGERVVVRTVPGQRGPGTATVTAYSQKQQDLLERIQRRGCAVGLQLHLDMCGLPSDPTATTKILDYYLATPGTLSYSNLGDISGESKDAVTLSLPFSIEDIIQILKVSISRVTMTETEAFNDIYFDLTEKCADDCGKKQDRCEVGIAVSDPVGGYLYPSGQSNVWYTTDFGATWAITAANPFAEVDAVAGRCLVIGDRWVVFQSNASITYAGRCSISDDHGAAWAEVDMGGAVGDYVLGVFMADAGNIWAVGSDGTIWYSSDRCDSWTQQVAANAVTTNDLYAVATADGDTIYAVGQNNTLIQSTDAGASWTVLTGPAASNVILFAIAAMTNYNVLIGGEIDTDEACLWYSDDGCDTFVVRAFTGSTLAMGRVRDIDAVNQQHIWMIHGTSSNTNRFFRSVDGSYSWVRWEAVTNLGLNALFACDVNNAWACGEPEPAQGGTGVILKAQPVS